LLSKYEELDGVKLPRKMVIKRDGKEYVDADRQEIKLLETIDDKEFAKP
jgi:hypothetical protein